jgi:hypothetical protein
MFISKRSRGGISNTVSSHYNKINKKRTLFLITLIEDLY